MGDFHARQPLDLASSGTLCAACQSRGVRTDHSPAGEQHKAWEARWAEDPDWRPADPDSPPSFGEVVKAFTPPGTDFEAFKASLHSQGAPGRIGPEMLAMLNQVAPPMMGGTSAGCPRCDHPHGGPPGEKCLEAEAHLGRSPLRRSPDLQLDAISGPRQAALAEIPDGIASAAAIAAHEMFTDFMTAGFTEDQALKLVVGFITSGGNGDGS